MRNGYIIDTLASVVIQEIVKISGKVIRFYQGVVYQQKIKILTFRRVREK